MLTTPVKVIDAHPMAIIWSWPTHGYMCPPGIKKASVGVLRNNAKVKIRHRVILSKERRGKRGEGGLDGGYTVKAVVKCQDHVWRLSSKLEGTS